MTTGNEQFQFNPSSALIVKPDTTIADCVRAMKDHGFGAVLVSEPYKANKTNDAQIAGIFTERDLLKWVDEIQKGGFWDKPVFLLMSKPVHTITLSELEQAPELMLTLRVRHLPLVHTDPSTGESVISMISMRDVLRNQIKNQVNNTPAIPREIQVGVIAESKGVRDLIRQMCAQRSNASLQTISQSQITQNLEGFTQQLSSMDYIFYDLDLIDSKQWAIVLKHINSLTEHPKIILIYNPHLHSDEILETLTKLGLSGRFSAHMKPLNIYLLLNQLI